MKTIFVSSTFKDMHKERDALQKITLPILYEEAKKRGESVEICDLRWGVNTEDMDNDTSSTKVLNVCLDEIDRCQPPMVVILGYRYGWIPDESIINSAAKRYDIVLDDLEKSVTSLEIEYGALSQKRKKDHTLFYFREIDGDAPSVYLQEDDYHFQKLKELKERIMKISGGSVKTYRVRWENGELCCVDDFAKMVANDVLEILQTEWETVACLSPLEKELRAHKLYAKDKLEHFLAKRNKADRLLSAILKNNSGALIEGESGSGKSTLMSYLSASLENEGYETIPIFSSLTTRTSNAYGVLELIVEALEDKLSLHRDKEITTIDEMKNRLYLLVNQCEKRRKNVAILVDSIDQLAADENREQLIFVPTKLSKYVKFIASSLPELGINSVLSKHQWEDATQEEIGEIIAGIEKARHRELSKEVKNAVIQKAGAKNPLYLDLLVQRLIMMNEDDFIRIRQAGDGMSAITSHQISLIENVPETLEEMSVCLFLDSAERINPELIGKCARYLAFSRYGLRQGDLKALLKDQWNGLDFSSFIHYLRDSLFIRADGRVDFVHRSFKAGLRRIFEEEEKEIQGQLLAYMSNLPQDDPIREQELAYHAICADDKGAYVAHILSTAKEKQRNNAIATAQRCIEDEGLWLNELCQHLENEETTIIEGVGAFLIDILPGYFGQTRSQKKAKAKSLYTSIEIISEAEQTTTILSLLVNAYIQLGDISSEINEGFSIEDMCMSYESAILCGKALEDNYQLARGYVSCAKGYAILTGVEYSLCAKTYYKKAIELLSCKKADEEAIFIDAYIGLAEQSVGQEAKEYLLQAMSLLNEAKKSIHKEKYLIKKVDIVRRITIAERAITVQDEGYGAVDNNMSYVNDAIEEIEGYIQGTPVVDYELLDALASLYSDIVNTEIGVEAAGFFGGDSQNDIFNSLSSLFGGFTQSTCTPAYERAKALYQKIYEETMTTSSLQALTGIKTIGATYMGDIGDALSIDESMANVFSDFFENQECDEHWSVFGFDKERDFSQDYENNDLEGLMFGNLSFLMVDTCKEGLDGLERAYEKRRELLDPWNDEEARLAKYCMLSTYTEACLYTDTMRGYLRAQRIGKEAKKVVDGLVKDFERDAYKKAQYTTYYRLGCAYFASEDYNLSYNYLKKAKQIMKDMGTEEELDVALIDRKMAKTLEKIGNPKDWQECFELMNEAVSIIEQREQERQMGDQMLSMLGDASILAPNAKTEFYRSLIAAAARVNRIDVVDKAAEAAGSVEFLYDEESLQGIATDIERARAYVLSKQQKLICKGIDMLLQSLEMLSDTYDFDVTEYCSYDDLKVYEILSSIAGGYMELGKIQDAEEYFEKAYSYCVTFANDVLDEDEAGYYSNAKKHLEYLAEYMHARIGSMDRDEAKEKCLEISGLLDRMRKAYRERKYFYDKQRGRTCIAIKAVLQGLLFDNQPTQENFILLNKSYSQGLENALIAKASRFIEYYAINIVNRAESNQEFVDETVDQLRYKSLIVLTNLYASNGSDEYLVRAKVCGDLLTSIYDLSGVDDQEFLKSYKLSLEHGLKNAEEGERELITQLIDTINSLLS
ncbi:MAG: DUF4062 domain-containing protein [Clostridia bacterium]|nr:DUF4062 domain-containing protein [Clostridia bacterium]